MIKKLVVFDKDGTLIDIHHYWGKMIELRAALIADRFAVKDKESLFKMLINVMGLDVETGLLKSSGPVGIRPRVEIVRLLVDALNEKGFMATEAEVEDVFQEIDRFSIIAAKTFIKKLPGVDVLLSTLKSNGQKLAIATTDLHSRAEMAMDISGINKYLDGVIGADDVQSSKPSPDMLLALMDRFGVAPTDTVMVGDATVDQAMAASAGVDFIGVKTGLFTADQHISSGCWVDDMAAVGSLLCK